MILYFLLKSFLKLWHMKKRLIEEGGHIWISLAFVSYFLLIYPYMIHKKSHCTPHLTNYTDFCFLAQSQNFNPDSECSLPVTWSLLTIPSLPINLSLDLSRIVSQSNSRVGDHCKTLSDCCVFLPTVSESCPL